MQRTFDFLGWSLVIAAVGLIVTNFYSPLEPQKSILEGLKSAAIPAGILLALSGHFFTQARGIKDSTEKRSKFYLESCVKGYEEAQNLLSDGNNDRVKWIAAGRALIYAKELATNVTLQEHKRVLELDRLKYRNYFYHALKDKPATFFYGAKDYFISTEDAAKLSTAKRECIGGVSSFMSVELCDKSIYAVWEAAQWPEEYEELLGRTFSAEEQLRLCLPFPGLHQYLEYREQYQSNCGKLYQNPT